MLASLRMNKEDFGIVRAVKLCVDQNGINWRHG